MDISVRLERERDIYNFPKVSKWRRKGGDRRSFNRGFSGTGIRTMAKEERRHTKDRRKEWLRLISRVIYPRALDEGY